MEVKKQGDSTVSYLSNTPTWLLNTNQYSMNILHLFHILRLEMFFNQTLKYISEQKCFTGGNLHLKKTCLLKVTKYLNKNYQW